MVAWEEASQNPWCLSLTFSNVNEFLTDCASRRQSTEPQITSRMGKIHQDILHKNTCTPIGQLLTASSTTETPFSLASTNLGNATSPLLHYHHTAFSQNMAFQIVLNHWLCQTFKGGNRFPLREITGLYPFSFTVPYKMNICMYANIINGATYIEAGSFFQKRIIPQDTVPLRGILEIQCI